MPFALEQLTQGLCLADKIDPVAAGAGTYNSSGIDFAKFRRILFEIQLGSVGASGTVDAKLQSAAAANFATPHNIAGAAITQVTNASNSNTRLTLEVRDDQLQAGDRYVRLQIITGGATITFGATGWAAEADFKPANKANIASVTQQVVT